MATIKLNEYCKLLGMDYQEAVNCLLVKYGSAKDSYVINEKSYNKFLNGEISNFIKNKKFSRINEGLYCHHIAENKYYNLSEKGSIFKQRPPFSTQDKDALVYCDLIEHAILHKLIKSNGNVHSNPKGLIDNIKAWYIDKKILSLKDWQKKCYKQAELNVNEAQNIYNALIK